MLLMGTWSMMLPAAMLLVRMGRGVATKVLGAMPKLHFSRPPVQVWWGMCGSS